jgi:hypothetical protein
MSEVKSALKVAVVVLVVMAIANRVPAIKAITG